MTTPTTHLLYDITLGDRIRAWQAEALALLAGIEAEAKQHGRALAQLTELRGDVEATVARMPADMAHSGAAK